MGGHKAYPLEREWNWVKGDPTPGQMFNGMDWNAVRRGRQVYSEVFAPCHPLHRLTYNHFQAFMTKEEIKKLASQVEVTDTIPDGEGNMITRNGKPTDWLPMPYPNAKAAAFANNGAEPPDLRTIVFGVGHSDEVPRTEFGEVHHHQSLPFGGVNYIFALMTGYHWGETLGLPPWAGQLKPGQFWNPYFKGGVLAMPPPLSDGLIEYEDGTPATVSQMSKDVCNFLRWANEIEYDDRRVAFWKAILSAIGLNVLFFHAAQKNSQWMYYQRITFRWWKNVW